MSEKLLKQYYNKAMIMIFVHSLKFPILCKEQFKVNQTINRLSYRHNRANIEVPMTDKKILQIHEDNKNKLTPSADNERANHLAQRLQNGEKEVFEELYYLFEKKIFNLCFRMIPSYEEATDLTQEIFVKVHKNIHKFRGESNFYTWLYTVALNTCRNRRDKINRLRRHETNLGASEEGQNLIETLFADPRSHNSPTHRLESEELRQWIAENIAGLSPKYREIIIMKDISLMSYDEIAHILDCSLGTVKSRLNRARKMLKEKLESSRNRNQTRPSGGLL